jgi:hypothetical protein
VSPLHTTASSLSFPSLRPEIRLQTCKKIRELGGDRYLVDRDGLSVSGKFRLADRDLRDFWGCHGSLHFGNPSYVAQAELEYEMELLLLPSTGPMAADEAVVDASSPDSDVEDDRDNWRLRSTVGPMIHSRICSICST